METIEKYIETVNIELEKLESEADKEFDLKYYKACANWVIGPVMSYLNKEKLDMDQFPVKPRLLKQLICYVEFTDLISFNTASSKVLPEMISNPDEHPWDIMERLNLIQSNDEDAIKKIIIDVISKYPEKAADYRGGKVGLAGFFIGEVMKAAGKGKVNPKIVNELTKKMLDDTRG